MLGFETDNSPTPDLVAHIIQVSLSPVFLLTALGTLLSVFSLRLARVADKVDSISEATKGAAADEARVYGASNGLYLKDIARDIRKTQTSGAAAAGCNPS